jgi:hypothetical protein
MIKFLKPHNLNGAELLTELNAGGVTVEKLPMIDGDGNLWLDIAESDKDQAISIVSAHNGTTVTPNNSTAKAALLAKLGITADEAALLLS